MRCPTGSGGRASGTGAKKVKEMDRDAIAAKGPEEALAVVEERLDEANKKRKEAIGLVAGGGAAG